MTTMATQLMPLLPRGVYKARYRVKGVEVLVAIDSKGDVRKHLKIEHPCDEPRLKRALEELLDMLDPQLKLVRPERGSLGWPYDGSPPPPTVRTRLVEPRRNRRRLH